ncbi:hypothetical protein F5Y16DRAFT_424155 [Xylariaceae sp. FL0255]|nr:hypothetical protein F5Y16DRAFT_424155 [Xylariaceae sp. FL0255]
MDEESAASTNTTPYPTLKNTTSVENHEQEDNMIRDAVISWNWMTNVLRSSPELGKAAALYQERRKWEDYAQQLARELAEAQKSLRDTEQKYCAYENLKNRAQRLSEELVVAQAALVGSEQKYLAYENTNKSQVQKLKDNISKQQDQILRLQPYQSELTPDKAKKYYKELSDSINQWVENWTDRFINDPEERNILIKFVRESPLAMKGLRQFLSVPENRDLASAIGEGSDHDVEQSLLSSVITRFIIQRVFQAPISGAESQERVKVLDSIEKGLKEHSKPKIDVLAIRAWRAQAYHAMFNDPEYTRASDIWTQNLLDELDQILLFARMHHDRNIFLGDLAIKIITPAVNLRKLFEASTDEYYFESSKELIACNYLSPALGGSLIDGVNFINVARANKRITRSSIAERNITGEIFQDHFYVMCSASPAFLVREPLRGQDELQNPVTLCQERVLIEFDVADKKASRTVKEEDKIPTWLTDIFRINNRAALATKQM